MKNKYISVYARCKCGHLKRFHTISGARPSKKTHNLYLSCGKLSYPVWNRYKGKCRFCRCDKFVQLKKEEQSSGDRK